MKHDRLALVWQYVTVCHTFVVLGLQLYDERSLFSSRMCKYCVVLLVPRLETVRKYLEAYWTKLGLLFPCAGLLLEQRVESWKVEKNCLKQWGDKRRQLKEISSGVLNPSHLAMLFLASSVSSASHSPPYQICPPFKTTLALEWRCQQLRDPVGCSYLISCLLTVFKHMPTCKGHFSSMPLEYI